MNLIRTLLAIVSFSVLLIACASPTGLAVGADSGESTPINSNNSVSTQIIANEISDLSSNALIMEQNQGVIVDSLTQMMDIQDERDREMEEMLEAVYIELDLRKAAEDSSGSAEGPSVGPIELSTKVEFLEELIVGQIADSAQVSTNITENFDLSLEEAFTKLDKANLDANRLLEIEMEALREARLEDAEISKSSKKEIETINRKITDITNNTSNIDNLKEINDLKNRLEIKDAQIADLELKNRKLSEKLSTFIDHFNLRNKGNEFKE